MTELESKFLTLIRIGVGKESPDHIGKDFFSEIDWDALMALATRQGLSAVMLDGIEPLQEGNRPPKQVLLQWIGSTLQGFEYRYELCRRVIAEMASFYNDHGIKMMIIKGFACSLNWPKPDHRPCGDIDIWQFGKQKLADEVLSQEKGMSIDYSHHHHTVFYWCVFMVENHYDFLNVHHHKSNRQLEEVLKSLGADDSHCVAVYGEKVYLPSPNLHALFLLRHSMAHFAATELTLRQLLDWAFFVEVNGKDVNWEWMEGVLKEYGMWEMFNIINEICVEDLGFNEKLFPHYLKRGDALKDRVLNEIISPAFSEEVPSNLLCRVVWKFRRWRANGWKHKLCYKESMWSAFWSGVWNHLLKPASI